MIIPTVASLSEDAMNAVPLALRQGSLAMGANRMQTTLRVVFPAAISGSAPPSCSGCRGPSARP